MWISWMRSVVSEATMTFWELPLVLMASHSHWRRRLDAKIQ
jgi:hypothetical protein